MNYLKFNSNLVLINSMFTKNDEAYGDNLYSNLVLINSISRMKNGGST